MKHRKRIYYTDSQKALMWDRWQRGESQHKIAALFDRRHSSVRRILAESGGIRPPQRRRSARVRPKMMTVVAIMAGLLPIMWSTGTGSEVMRRIAAPMISGMVSSTVLTLVVIPVIYALVKRRQLTRDGARESLPSS